jgi:protease I
MQLKKAVIVVGPSVEDTEFAYPFYRLQEEKFIVDTASNGGIKVTGKYGLPIDVNVDIKQLNAADYDLVIVPGGLESPDRLRQIPQLLSFLREMHESRKVIGSICHGPWVLISAKIVQNKKMTIYVGCKDDLINAGANYIDAPVVSDDNIVTSPHFRYNAVWMREVIDVYNKLNFI